VACDIAVYEKGPARPTGGAGAVAMLIGPNARMVIDPIRATFIDHQYDFYKPVPSSEYPIVDGGLSINCYLSALEQCYKTLQKKYKAQANKDFSTKEFDYLCFHCPFYKMVQKAFGKVMEL
jgi:hydroxymethylglutaryl-CoA synthase